MAVDLNIDLGELPHEAPEFYRLATVANVACGGHAGDPASMWRACRSCRAAGTRLVAHPSYPDRAHFGRRSQELTVERLRRALRVQLGDLRDVARRVGIAVVGVKPHGALYHDSSRSPELARLVVEATLEALGEVALVGPPTGALLEVCRARGLVYRREGFADRGYLPDGGLVPRGTPGALLDDPVAAAERASAWAREGRFDTLCLHGDHPRALEFARALRAALEVQGSLRGPESWR